jgi:chromosome segregation ATPase
MGRPPIGKRAMTGAERTRRYRELYRRTHPVTKPPSARELEAELEQARNRIGQLEAEIEKLRKQAAAPPVNQPSNEIAALRQQLAQAQAELERVRGELARAVAEQPVDRASLSRTAKERLDAAIRQHKKKLDDELEVRAWREARRFLEEISVPAYAREWDETRAMLERRKAI